VAPAALLGYATARFVSGADHSLDAARDFAPYAYASVAFLSAASFHRSTAAGRARTMTIIRTALLFHLAWVVAVRAWPALPSHLPTVNSEQGLHLLTMRGATDLNLVGVTAALFLYRFLHSGRKARLILVVAPVLLVASMPARAALLGTGAALVTAGLLSYARPAIDARHWRRRIVTIGALPSLLVAAGSLLPTTTAGSQLLSGLGVTEAVTDTDISGLGTVQARQTAWRLVIDYNADNHGQLTGLGFGPDYLFDSGARVPLGGSIHLRSPHNYLLSVYARLGLLGLALFCLLIVAAVRAAVASRTAAASEEVVAFAACYFAAVLVTALVGVELESPFCAVPFYWCVGILLSRPVSGAASTEPG
jgi:hypothetical protein